MPTAKKSKTKAEFGDFQTPVRLAVDACNLLRSAGIAPAAILEPTCGIGNFLIAAIGAFPNVDRAIGFDINEKYVAEARARISSLPHPYKAEVQIGNFFTLAWDKLMAEMPEPILAVGNPPWVTNAHLGSLGSDNLPTKSNFQNHAGFDAMTGKSNFDISEWMLVRLLESLQGKRAIIAMLCKTAVGRKVLTHAWKNGIRVHDSSLYLIDAAAHFEAAVDACLLVCHTGGSASYDCRVFGGFSEKKPTHTFGYRDHQIVAEVDAYDTWKHLQGIERYKWRSGIKHDCSAVMELHRVGNGFGNGLKERVTIEPDYLYPMLKSSDIAKGNTTITNRFMLVPQKTIGENMDKIKTNAPATWAYLEKHGSCFDRRGSSIYKKRPRFSIFGVGPYSFSPWKVAISGFYKCLHFRVVGPIDGKPVVFDDTCNFISCQTKAEAESMATLLNSPESAGFFKAFIFWDAKRPLTVDLLSRIDLLKVAEASQAYSKAMAYRSGTKPKQLNLFGVAAV